MVWYIASNTHKVMTTFIFVMFVLVWSDWDNGYLQSISAKFCLQSHRDVWHFLWSCISYSVHCFVKVFCSDTMVVVIHCAWYRQLGYCFTLAYTHCGNWQSHWEYCSSQSLACMLMVTFQLISGFSWFFCSLSTTVLCYCLLMSGLISPYCYVQSPFYSGWLRL